MAGKQRSTDATAQSGPWYFSQQVLEHQRHFLSPGSAAPVRPRMVWCGCERVRQDYFIDRKSLPLFGVEYVVEGEGTVALAGREYHLQPGVAFAYSPDLHHVIRNDPARPMLKYFVGFVGSEAARLLKASRLGRWAPLQVPVIGEMVELFELIQRAAAGGGKVSHDLCDALVPVLLLKIEQAAQPDQPVTPRSMAAFQRARRHIDRNYLQLRTVEEVARACHLTPVYLSRLFRRFAQVGPHQYLMRLKMNRAAALLFQHELLVKEVAAEVGFADAFHFSRAFKRAYGISPDRFVRYRVGRGRPVGGRDA
jgi:AraC-like DNA-binding protein